MNLVVPKEVYQKVRDVPIKALNSVAVAPLISVGLLSIKRRNKKLIISRVKRQDPTVLLDIFLK